MRGETHVASRQSAVTSPHPADVYKVEAWSRGYVQETPLQREGLEKNCRLGVLVERINYLCSHPRGESGKAAARPQEEVYLDHEVRGRAGKHVAAAKQRGLRSRSAGTGKIRDLLQLFCNVMQTAACVINDTEDVLIRHPVIKFNICITFKHYQEFNLRAILCPICN